MKRVAALILLILYFTTSTGATLHYHYCMGEMANTSLWSDKEKCGKCGMEKKETLESGCCKDELQWIKIEDDQKATHTEFEISKPQFESISFAFFKCYLVVLNNHYSFAESKTPLRSCELATYLLNCVFLI